MCKNKNWINIQVILLFTWIYIREKILECGDLIWYKYKKL